MKSAARPPHQPAAVPAPLAGAPQSHQPGRAAVGPASPGGQTAIGLAGDIAEGWRQEAIAARARAEHWAGQADRLARQVEAMRAVMLEVAEQISDSERGAERWAERLRQAAGGEEE